MRYFTRKALARGGDAWNEALDRYKKHYSSIEQKLADSARRLDRCSLHDMIVTRVERPLKDTLLLRGDWCDVAFSGVQRFTTAGIVDGDAWLYDEIDVHDQTHFVLRVLLENSELLVVAQSVSVFDRPNKRWLIAVDSVHDRMHKKKRRS